MAKAYRRPGVKSRKTITGTLTAIFFLVLLSEAAAQQTLRVAAIQTESDPGMISENLAGAEKLVDQAAADGAELILLPELMPSGYIIAKDIWGSGESSNGQTVSWLTETAARLGVWLGTSFVESDGIDFFNTFVLTSPEGSVAGTVRKERPAAHETFFTRGYPNSHIIEAEIGSIGVVICFEATLCDMIRRMHSASVDLVLLPTADPVPESDAGKDPSEWDHDLTETAQLYARRLGVPAVLANQGGSWQSPLPGALPSQDSIFRGQSSIADSDASLLVSLEQAEGYIVADVVLDPALKVSETPPCTGQYCKEMPLSSRIYQEVVEAAGSLWYACSCERRRKAQEVIAAEHHISIKK